MKYTSFYEYPNADKVMGFLRKGPLFKPTDIEPVRGWLESHGLLEAALRPKKGVEMVHDSVMVKWFYNEVRFQMLFELLTEVPRELERTIKEVDYYMMADILLIDRSYREYLVKTCSELLHLAGGHGFESRETYEDLIKSSKDRIELIDGILANWREFFPTLALSDREFLIDRIRLNFTVNDAFFLYREGISDILMGDDHFEEYVGAELEHLGELPEDIRPIVGRVVRFCQAMHHIGFKEQEEVLARIDKRLEEYGIEFRNYERIFMDFPKYYREDYRRIRSGELTLGDLEDYERRDERMVEMALKVDPGAIRFLDEYDVTEDMAYRAVTLGSPENIRYIRDVLQTRELLSEALERDPEVCVYVNEERWDESLALIVVRQKGVLLNKLPFWCVSEDVAITAIRQNVAAMVFAPEHCRTERFYTEAVTLDPHAIANVPEEHRTVDICLLAVRKDPNMAKYVPDRIKEDPAFLSGKSDS